MTAPKRPPADGAVEPSGVEPSEVAPGALLTPKQVAQLFGVDARTLSAWARQGRIAAQFTLGGHRRFRGEDVARLLAEARARTTGLRCGASAD